MNNNNYNRNGAKSKPYNQPPQKVEPLELPSDYVDEAEEIMRTNSRSITTSKIRRLFSLIMEIYNIENLRTGDTLSEDSKASISMARIRFAYECGRDNNVKSFVETAKLMQYLKGIKSRSNFIDFARYMEALVSYHKYFGGKEN